MALLKNVEIDNQNYWSVPSFWRTWSLTQCVYVRISYDLGYESRILCFSYFDKYEMIGYCRQLRCSLGSFKIFENYVYLWSIHKSVPQEETEEKLTPTPRSRRYTECSMFRTPLSLINHSSTIIVPKMNLNYIQSFIRTVYWKIWTV